MKKTTLAWGCLLVLAAASCTRDANDPLLSSSKVSAVTPATAATIKPNVVVNNCGSCGAIFNGSWSSNGFHAYSYQSLNFSCLAAGDTILIDCEPLDVPNTFTVYDGQYNVVAYTPWLGNASYQGPWGSSVHTGQANNFISFILQSPQETYNLAVATCVNGESDYWTATIQCNAPAPCCTTTPPPTCVCTSGAAYSGSSPAGLNGFYIYPNQALSLGCAPVGDSVIIDCQPLDIPNTFSIVDQNGHLVASTNWIGNANYSGPWGSSIATLQANNYLGFVVTSSSNTYYLQVATAVSTSRGNDAWNASVTCKAN